MRSFVSQPLLGAREVPIPTPVHTAPDKTLLNHAGTKKKADAHDPREAGSGWGGAHIRAGKRRTEPTERILSHNVTG
ncbi:hypothetical protein GCM10027404_08320 [Arthrobacter tumbae]